MGNISIDGFNSLMVSTSSEPPFKTARQILTNIDRIKRN